MGGLVEHTLHVTQICDFFSKLYPMLNRDLLLTAAMFHDIGKLTELLRSRQMITRMMVSYWDIL